MLKFVYHVQARFDTPVEDDRFRTAYAIVLIDFKNPYGARLLADALLDDAGWDLLDEDDEGEDDEGSGYWEYEAESLAEAMEDPEHGHYFREAHEHGYSIVFYAYPEDMPE
ncbi:MAG: hypothetical protein ACTS3F_10540 [Phycisphaerales bacterium]